MTKKITLLTALSFLTLFHHVAFSQAWTTTDYKKALWMTTRFYGAQRSGDNNWTIYNHDPGVAAALVGKAFIGDADGGTNLSGGWHDCGDHVKFGQTQFYSAYMLLKGYAEFPTGYDDKYSFDYYGYKTSGKWNFEETGHDPNCIPDVLDEMKHETDFVIKCTPNGANFYYQVGDGNPDHARWETAVKMQTNSVATGGQPRSAYKNPDDGSMPALCAATLALMARMYQPYDAAYAATCLTHAQYAYTYAKAHTNTVQDANGGSFYGSNNSRIANWATMCAELYWTTGTAAYQTEALGYEATIAATAGWSFDYDNNNEIALYNLAKLGNASATTKFNNKITGHYMLAGSRNAQGIYDAHGGGWGALRYNGIASFLIALYSKLNNDTTPATLAIIYKDIDYIMGSNTPKRSYIVGFTPAAGGPFLSPGKPHHRNVFLNDANPSSNPGSCDNTLVIPAKNRQLGALVGGKRDGSYSDDRCDYANSEVCIDYNACLVGALGFINSRLAPVTISCGANACRQPSLGANFSICGSSFPVTLNANTATPAGVSYKWYTWNGTTATLIGSATGSTYSASAAGSYIVVRDSSLTPDPGVCTKSDTITITSTLPAPIISPAGPVNLCDPSSINFTVTNTASFPGSINWQWSKGGSAITGQTTSTLSNVRQAGTYRITASIGGCTATFDEEVVTSSLPTPVDGCRAGTGAVSLSITNPGLNGTNYNWYATAGSATPLTGGTATTTFTTPSITSTTTFYVQDMSAVSDFVGPSTIYGGLQNWGCNAQNLLLFTATTNFTLKSVKVPFININSAGSGVINIQILDASNAVKASFTSDATAYPASPATQLLTFTFNSGNGVLIDRTSWGANLKMGMQTPTCENVNGDPAWNQTVNPAYSTGAFISTGSIVTITGAERSGSAANTDYMYFYDWEISTGTTCARLPVVANVDGSCSLPVGLINFYANKNSDHVYLSWATSWEQNNDYFSIERSLDGVNYSSLNKIKGYGTSESVKLYAYSDYESFNGATYYRIAQYDLDGALTYSEVVTVTREDNTLLSVAPNPFTNSSEIKVLSNVLSPVHITITDVSGAVKFTSEEYSTNESILVGEDLPKGLYIIQAVFNDKIYTSKMVKQ